MPSGVYSRPSVEERYWAKIRKLPNECFEWTGALTEQGYGDFRVNRGHALAHRWAYEHFVGPIPDGLEPDHLCRNRACANHNHLELVTHRENILRGNGPSAQNARKTECPAGHPYAGDNLYLYPNGNRRCQSCHREQSRKYGQQARQRAGIPERVIGPRSKKWRE